MASSVIPLNPDQRRQVHELERKIIKAADSDKMNDLINDFGELFELIPTAKLNRLHKIEGHRFHRTHGQTYFSKKSAGAKEAIAKLELDVKELTEVIQSITKILNDHHLLD
jgi:hypothetical protein